MVRMFPDIGPAATGSERAEPDIYWRLAKQLSDDFTVIHSLPWLAAVAEQIDGRPVPTGEVDFIILHPELGILAIEVKGGWLKYDRNRFVYVRTGEATDPVRQVRRGTHALAKWVVEAGGPGIRIGYAIAAPDSEMHGQPLPPALVDLTTPGAPSIVLDKTDLPTFGDRVVEIMQYWRQTLRNPPLTQSKLDRVVELILPQADYRPSWQTRIDHDTVTWLRLTDEQQSYLNRLIQEPRTVTMGRSGTGKTLLATTLARRLSEDGQRVLFISFNIEITQHLQDELSDTNVKVTNFHSLCRQAARLVKQPIARTAKWYKELGPSALFQAAEQGKMGEYDTLILDEAQVLQPDWISGLAWWFDGKKIAVFCDETQVFPFEEALPASKIAEIVGAAEPFILTVNLRSPRAVFDRLQEIEPANFQQHSPRHPEPDTFVEIASFDPLQQLRDTLHQLRDEGVPPESIAVLYPAYSDHLLKYDFDFEEIAGVTEKISRFRGMEAPVVIVWCGDSIQDSFMSCALSRATSRCIVIYNVFGLVKRNYGSFGAASSLWPGSIPDTLRETIKSGWPFVANYLGLETTEIVSRTARVLWSHDWGGWIVVDNRGNCPGCKLWLSHLELTTRSPIYHWRRGSVFEFLRFANPPCELTTKESGCNWVRIDRCKTCARERREPPRIEKELVVYRLCEECGRPVGQWFPVPEEAQILTTFDSMIAEPDKYKWEEKQQMGCCLVALGRLRTLPAEHQRMIAEKMNAVRIIHLVGLVLIGVDIIQANVGDTIELDCVRQKYPKWCPELAVDWHRTASNCCNTWIGHGWLEKVDTGIYQRSPIAGIDYPAD